MLNIVELLRSRGLPDNAKIKMARHLDPRIDVIELMLSGWFETYQSYQDRSVFNCDYLVSFIGLPRSKARFIGVYKVQGVKPASEVPLPNDYPHQEDEAEYFYQLTEVPGFEDLKERVIVHWGKSSRAWCQLFSEKEVVEVVPKGFTRPFPGYLDFVLSHDELGRICKFPEANIEWHVSLSSVAGVYLILEKKSGYQYVGAAYGAKGVMGRWQDYVTNGHGGNKILRDLVKDDPEVFRNFQYSLLHVLPKSLSNDSALKYEKFYKEKLGSRAFGLNAN